MTKEEIRDEVEIHIRACLRVKDMDISIADSLSKSMMLLLNDLGVVIKVERELHPLLRKQGPHKDWSEMDLQRRLDSAGYVAVEPLI